MEFEFWWLLSWVVFFGLGWIAARIDIKHLLSEARALPASYFKGINFLVKQQEDKAIEAFIEVAKGNPQTVELQFALGSLFRRRGEAARAIRMHQNLLERTDLQAEDKLNALFELAQDYLKAGLLDRAEELLDDLRKTSHSRAALGYLQDIYVQEKEWAKAIAVLKELNDSSHDYQKEIANYYCEMAVTDYMQGRSDSARDYLREALKVNRRCVRANVILGEWEAREQHHEAAIEAWMKIEAQSPDHLALVAEGLLQSYQALGKVGEGLKLLRGYQERYPALDLLDVVFQATLETEGVEAAYQLVRDDLRRSPTMLGLDKLLEAQLLQAPPERQRDLQLIKNLVHSHGSRLAVYQCGNCGFTARQFYWHCPACASWESYPPRLSAELEKAGKLNG